MTDYTEVVKKLRNYGAFTAIPPFSVDLYEAADAMEALNNLCMDLQGELKRTWDNYTQEKVLREQLSVGLTEAVKRIPRWIPVTERLPDCEWGAEVGNIEWISFGKVDAGCFGRGGKYRDAYFRTWRDGTEGIDAKDADYWRSIQIPEPPKEKTC